MTKREIRSLIKNVLPKYGFTAEYHPRFIDAAIEKVLAAMYNEIWAADPHSLQRFTKRYGGTVPIGVLEDVTANIYYSDYPVMVIPIMDKASGVRRITTRQQGGMTFHPMDIREVELVASGSFFNTITNKIGYVVTQDRVEYYGMTAAIAAAGVRMDLLVAFSEYEDTETVFIPETTNANGEGFADRVVRSLSAIQPADLIDDNKASSTNNVAQNG